MPQGVTIQVAESQVTEIQLTVGVFDNPDTARVPIDVLSEMGVDGAGSLIAQGFAGSGADSISVESLEFPVIGEDSFSLTLHMKTAVADLDGHMVYFVRDRVRAQFVVFGLAGELSVDDTLPLAKLFDQRIQDNKP